MIEKIKTAFLLLLSLCFLWFALTACSGQENPGRSGDTGAKETPSNKAIDIGTIIGKGEDIPVTSPPPVLLNEKRVHDFGEAVTSGYPTNENPKNAGLQYVVRAARLYSRAGESGIETAERQEYGEVYSLTEGAFLFLPTDDFPFLLCDVNVKNINHPDGRDLHIGELSLVHVDPSTKVVTEIASANFFSKSKYTPASPQYRHYVLAKGESADVQIGWLVDPKQYSRENLYLKIMGRNGIEFIWLNL